MPIKISAIKPNASNPRIIKNEKFKQLCDSIKSFPKMMEIRPIIIDENNIVQGGNMRLKALIELGYKDVPNNWIKKVDDFTPEELKRFIVLDNVSFGEWDWDILSNEWSTDELIEWGVDVAPTYDPINKEKEVDENIDTDHECPKCHYKW